MMETEESHDSLDLFAKERSFQRSGQPSQRKIYALLFAIEQTIVEQNENLSPLAYFGALMTLLEQQGQSLDAEGVEDIVSAVLHLLAVVFSRIPSNVLKLKFNDVASTIGSTLQHFSSSALMVRDALTCVEFLLVAQDAMSWNSAFQTGSLPPKTSELRSLFQIILLTGIDERPKVRKKGQETLKRLLTRHPAFGASSCDYALGVPGLRSSLFRTIKIARRAFSHLDVALVDSVLRSLLGIRPFENDVTLSSAWMDLVSRGFVCLSTLMDDENASSFMDIEREKRRAGILRCLKKAIPHSILSASLTSRDPSDTLRAMIGSLQSVLANAVMRNAWGAVLTISEAAFERIGSEGPALLDDLLSFIVTIRDTPSYLEEFPYRTELESCLQIAALNLGLERFTLRAPLNLFDVEDAKESRRPYLFTIFHEELLPLSTRLVERALELKTQGHSHPSKLFETLALQIFKLFPVICNTVPVDLAEVFTKLAPKLGKIIQTTPEENGMTEFLSEIKPLVYAGLTSLITKYFDLSELDNEVESNIDAIETARAGLHRVKGTSNKFLNTLCNQYTFVDPASLELNSSKGSMLQSLHDRGNSILEGCIGAFLLVAEGGAITSYFYSLVKSLLQHQASDDAVEEALFRHRSYLVIDLLLVMLPFLPDAKRVLEASANEESFTLPDTSALFLLYKVLVGQLRDDDATLQKKTYKGLNLLLDLLPIQQASLQDLITTLLDPVKVVEYIPELEDHESLLMEFVPMALSEVILCTKEASEKARTAAFECLVSMGRQMHSVGNQLKRADEWNNIRGRLAKGEKVESGDGDDEMETETTARVSLREFFVMVTAGLAGESAHMQSAAINCLARLIFEFSDSLEHDLIKELVSTVLLFMSSNNREIIKAVLGFIKVAIVSLPQEYLEDELENIVTSILTHSRDHKSHFKSKVRHIFERLIRRFSVEAIQGFVPESDSRLITNIRKRRERLKKKKAQERSGQNSDSEDGDPRALALKKRQQMQSRQREFEDALHGSESDLDSDNEDDYLPAQLKHEAKKTKTAPSGAVIREGQDVLDFLDSQVVSKITSKSVTRKAKRGADDEDFEEDATNQAMEEVTENVEDLYLESLKGEGAFIRLPDGRIKFLNKRKRDERERDEEGTTTWNRIGRKTKSAADIAAEKTAKDKMMGRQYRAKKAQGDLKRPGMPDPFAYIPLSGKIVGNMRKSAKLNPELKEVIRASKDKDDSRPSKKQKNVGIKKGNKKHK
ncbi:armadillo-type protein [Chytridium lagenaria]|nr:armadillo-type protein [Chytridium lagenaria]